MIEVKLSQGAKPAHGGILPASKITQSIADARGLGAPPWRDCNSPPRHGAFHTVKGLLLFVQGIRFAHPPISPICHTPLFPYPTFYSCL